MRPPGGRGLPSAVPVIALVLMAIAAVAPVMAQTDSGIRIDRVDASALPEVTIVLTPPPALRGVQFDGSAVSLTENGESRPVEVGFLVDEPLQVVLAVDTSGSMANGALEGAKEAAAAFVNQMPASTQIAVMSFSSSATIESGFTEDEGVTLAAIDGLAAAGDTELYDAVVASVEAFDPEVPARRFIVALSDGGDTASESTLEEAADLLSNSGISFYAVELQTEESDPAALEELVTAGAGRLVSAEDTAALVDAYGQIASELVNQVLITYRTIAGGQVSIVVEITSGVVSARGSARIALPVLPGEATATTTTTRPVTTTTAAGAAGDGTDSETPTSLVVAGPDAFVGSGGGFLASPGALVAGTILFFMAALIVFGLTVLPSSPEATSMLRREGAARRAGDAKRGRPQGRWLTRLAESTQSLADTVLRRSRQRPGLSQALEAAGSGMAPGEFVVLTATAFIVGFALGIALLNIWGALMLGILGLVAPRLVLANRIEKRRNAFGDQLEGTLQLMAGSLRAGYGLMQAVNAVANEAPQPTSDEFSRIVVETRLGRDLIDALHAMADRVANEDFRWVTQAIDIQRSVGGDLAQVLDTVAETVRDRNRIRRQIKALSAEGRISAYLLIALPFVITGFILVRAPDFLEPLVATAAGRLALAAGSILMIIGVIWIRRIVRLVF